MSDTDDIQTDLFASFKEALSGFFKKKEPPRREVSPEFSPDTLVSFSYNPRFRRSFRCSLSGLFGKPEVILPAYMKSEDFAPVRELVAEWALLARRRKTAKAKAELKELTGRIWDATDQKLADKGEPSLEARSRIPPIRPRGKVHDLEQILSAVNDTYFEGGLTCRITWSGRRGGLSYHTVRRDPYTGEPFHLISISRGYDCENCPLYAVAGVVYHECLHIAIPPTEKNGRRTVHGRNFRAAEKRYIYYDEWQKWHKEVLPLNVRRLLREK